jgi:cytochrome c-type biogenesis protein CcmH
MTSRPMRARARGRMRAWRAAAGMHAWFAAACLAVLLLQGMPAHAQVADAAPVEFRDADEARRFHALATELRCVMCQNQSLADSNAQIAADLRREVVELMREGHTDAEIREFLVARYGEFVLYRPRLGASTWLLWFGPLLVLAAGAIVLVRVVRARARRQALEPVDGEPS